MNHELRIKNYKLGMSLLEILIVVAIFAILGVITTRAVLLTLQGSKKSESLVKVRENLDYSLGIIERQLRNADSVTECPNSDTHIISYKDQEGNTSTFSCENMGTLDPYVASASSRLTNNEVKITSCYFVCEPGTSVNPPVVSVTIEAEDANATGIEASKVSATTQIYLRNY